MKFARSHAFQLSVVLALGTLIVGACALSPAHAHHAGAAKPLVAAEVKVAWIQRAAPEGWSLRAIVGEGSPCPQALVEGQNRRMAERASPITVPTRSVETGKSDKPSRFPERVCELKIDAASTGLNKGSSDSRSVVQVGPHKLKLPTDHPKRIVVLGDTGCRLKQSTHSFQACSDGSEWPFAQIARAAANLKPDLVIHLGDLHYRESPCPIDHLGCSASAWGYGADAWIADVFEPAAPLLNVAPWVFVRGNHESCARAGVGWYRYFDAWPMATGLDCTEPGSYLLADHGAPYLVPLNSDLAMLVMDSSNTPSDLRSVVADHQAHAIKRLEQVRTLIQDAPNRLWWAQHHPVFLNPSAADRSLKRIGDRWSAPLQTVFGPMLIPDKVDLMLNGHVHRLRMESIESPQLATLGVGHSGTAFEGTSGSRRSPDTAPVDDAHLVREGAIVQQHGFVVMDLQDGGWSVSALDVQGKETLRCMLQGKSLRCNSNSQPASAADR